MTHARHSVRRLLPLLWITALAGCSILPKSEAVDTYPLPSIAKVASAAAAEVRAPVTGLASLRINRPIVGSQLAGQRISLLNDQQQVQVYQGARWSESVPVLVRNRLLDAFLLDGRVPALSNDERGLYSDFELDSDLRSFQAELRAGQPEVVIVMDARLVRTETMRIVASQRFEIRQTVNGRQIPEVVQAFGVASDELSRQIVPWALSQMQSEMARAPLPRK